MQRRADAQTQRRTDAQTRKRKDVQTHGHADERCTGVCKLQFLAAVFDVFKVDLRLYSLKVFLFVVVAVVLG